MDQDRHQIEAILDRLTTVDDHIEALGEQIAALRTESAMYYEALRILITGAQSSGDGAVGREMVKEGGDEQYAHAEALVISAGKASASFLQRRLGVGYSRAAMLMDMLFERGVIGPVDGSKPRTVLAKPDSDTLS